MPRRPNFMIVITDQQSGNPYWPQEWEERNFPAMRWLKDHGVTFKRAYTNSCTCSPERVTLLTGSTPPSTASPRSWSSTTSPGWCTVPASTQSPRRRRIQA